MDDDPYCDVVGGEGRNGERVKYLMEPEGAFRWVGPLGGINDCPQRVQDTTNGD